MGYGVCIRLSVTEWCVRVCVYASMHVCAYMCVHASGHVTFGDDHCKVDSHLCEVSTDEFRESHRLASVHVLTGRSVTLKEVNPFSSDAHPHAWFSEHCIVWYNFS